MAETKPITTARGLGSAVRRVLRTDDRRGGEAAGDWNFARSKLNPAELVALPPAGTRRATLDRVIAALPGGHVAHVSVDGRIRLAIVVEVAPKGRG